MLQQIPRLPPALPPHLQSTPSATCLAEAGHTGAAQGHLLTQLAAMEAQQQHVHVSTRRDRDSPETAEEAGTGGSLSDPEQGDSEEGTSEGPWPPPNIRPKQWLPRLMRRSSSGTNAKEVLLRVDGCTVLVHDGPLYVDNVMRLFPNHVVVPASSTSPASASASASAASSAASSRSSSPNQGAPSQARPSTAGESRGDPSPGRSPSRSPLRSRLGLGSSTGPLSGRKTSPFRSRSTTGTAPLPAGRILMPGQKYDLIPAKGTSPAPLPSSLPKSSSAGTSHSPPTALAPVAAASGVVPAHQTGGSTVPAHQTGGITVPVKALRQKQSRLKGAYTNSSSSSASDSFPAQSKPPAAAPWEWAHELAGPQGSLGTTQEKEHRQSPRHVAQVLKVEGSQAPSSFAIPRAASLPSAQVAPEEVLGQPAAENKSVVGPSCSRPQCTSQAQGRIPSRRQLLQQQQQLEQLQQQVQALKLTRSGSQRRYSSPQAQATAPPAPGLPLASSLSLSKKPDTPLLPGHLGVSLGSAMQSAALVEAISSAAAAVQNPSMRRCSSLRASALSSIGVSSQAPPSTLGKAPHSSFPLAEDSLPGVQMFPLTARGVSATGKPPKAFPPPTGPVVPWGASPLGPGLPLAQSTGNRTPSPLGMHRRSSSLVPIACADVCTPMETVTDGGEGSLSSSGGSKKGADAAMLMRSWSSRGELGSGAYGISGPGEGVGAEVEVEDGPPTPRMGTGTKQKTAAEPIKSPRMSRSSSQREGARERPAKGHFERQRVAPVPLLSPRKARMRLGGGGEGPKEEGKKHEGSGGAHRTLPGRGEGETWEDDGVEEGNPTFELWKAKQEKKHRLFFSPGRAWMLGKDRQDKREKEKEERERKKEREREREKEREKKGSGKSAKARAAEAPAEDDFSWDRNLSPVPAVSLDAPSPLGAGEGAPGGGALEMQDLPFSAAELYMSGAQRNSPPRLWGMLSPKRQGRESLHDVAGSLQGSINPQGNSNPGNIGPTRGRHPKGVPEKEAHSLCTSPPAELETALQNFRSRLELMDEDGSTAARGRRARGVPGAGDTWRPALEDVDEDRSFRAINVATPERRRRKRFLSFNL